MQYDIAAIIWPSYSGDDPRTRIFWPEGYGEWQTVKAMTDKGYAGCRWPRKPLWGYVNEADPYVMEMQIRAAVRHKVNVFIYDWYWYDNRPFLENCLHDGFLGAPNNTDMRFYLMWANHDATYLWDKRNSYDQSCPVWMGTVTPQVFDEICERTIENYFKKPNYYTIDGCPVYMVFDVDNLIRSFGSVQACRAGLERFRCKTMAAGFPGLHLQMAMFGNGTHQPVPSDPPMTEREQLTALGFDSFTNYNWACCLDIDRDYAAVEADFQNLCREYSTWEVPYYPNLTVGWDNNVRFHQFVPGVLRDNTPEKFAAACENVKQYVDAELQKGRLHAPLITVNSWNEWTETSYLEPDDLYGYGYLEAIRDIF